MVIKRVSLLLAFALCNVVQAAHQGATTTLSQALQTPLVAISMSRDEAEKLASETIRAIDREITDRYNSLCIFSNVESSCKADVINKLQSLKASIQHNLCTADPHKILHETSRVACILESFLYAPMPDPAILTREPSDWARLAMLASLSERRTSPIHELAKYATERAWYSLRQKLARDVGSSTIWPYVFNPIAMGAIVAVPTIWTMRKFTPPDPTDIIKTVMQNGYGTLTTTVTMGVITTGFTEPGKALFKKGQYYLWRFGQWAQGKPVDTDLYGWRDIRLNPIDWNRELIGLSDTLTEHVLPPLRTVITSPTRAQGLTKCFVFTGSPGAGKSYCAKMIPQILKNEFHSQGKEVKFVELSVAGGKHGATSAWIEDAISSSKEDQKNAYCILLDEIHRVAPSTTAGAGRHEDHTSATAMGGLLYTVERLNKTDRPVFFLATTNSPFMVAPDLFRNGRMQVIHIPTYTCAERAKLIQSELTKIGVPPSPATTPTINYYAQLTAGATPSDLTTAMSALKEHSLPIAEATITEKICSRILNIRDAVPQNDDHKEKISAYIAGQAAAYITTYRRAPLLATLRPIAPSPGALSNASTDETEQLLTASSRHRAPTKELEGALITYEGELKDGIAEGRVPHHDIDVLLAGSIGQRLLLRGTHQPSARSTHDYATAHALTSIEHLQGRTISSLTNDERDQNKTGSAQGIEARKAVITQAFSTPEGQSILKAFHNNLMAGGTLYRDSLQQIFAQNKQRTEAVHAMLYPPASGASGGAMQAPRAPASAAAA